ncbi:MAG: hypothetical protein P1P76_06715 [Anaerolineales bacterium]|nr:hypothetical protein [Anaerolineales bacterium]
MKNRHAILISVGVILLITISCSLPDLLSGQSEIDIETAVEQTLAAASGETAQGDDTPADEPAATQASRLAAKRERGCPSRGSPAH